MTMASPLSLFYFSVGRWVVKVWKRGVGGWIDETESCAALWGDLAMVGIHLTSGGIAFEEVVLFSKKLVPPLVAFLHGRNRG
jgi:hypothetical protein